MDVHSLGSTPAVTAVDGTAPTTMTSPAPSPSLHGTLDGIAQLLGMSTADVRGALKQGQSITDLAARQGVSRDALVSSVESQIQAKRQAAGQPPADQASLDRMVNRAFDRHRHLRHHAGATAPAPAPATAPSDPPADGAGGVSVLA